MDESHSLGFRFAVEKRVTGEQGSNKLFHATLTLNIGLVSSAQGGGVAKCFVTAHEVAEGVADEDLADVGRVGQLVHHVHCIGHVGVEPF